jgi:hypothetical protein
MREKLLTLPGLGRLQSRFPMVLIKSDPPTLARAR